MKRIALISALAIITVAGIMFVTLPTPSEAAPGCTKTGTSGRDVMTGGKTHDVLCGVGGGDFIHGDGGPDSLRGGAGRDTLVGSGGADRAIGAGGGDRIFVTDGKSGDTAAGGAGFDRCYVDAGDQTTSCEKVYISYSAAQSRALETAVFGVSVIAEDLQAETPSPTPAPGTTVTVTVTVTPPPPLGSECSDPGPPQPETFCP